MGRTDTARREDVRVGSPQFIDSNDNRSLIVGHDADFLQANSDLIAVIGDEADILILGSPRKNFISYDEECSGNLFLGHCTPLYTGQNSDVHVFIFRGLKTGLCHPDAHKFVTQ